MYTRLNGERFTLSRMPQKIMILSKMLQAKKVARIKISYKKLRGRISRSHSWAKLGAPNFVIFEILCTLEWESRSVLGLNAAKNTDFLKQCFK